VPQVQFLPGAPVKSKSQITNPNPDKPENELKFSEQAALLAKKKLPQDAQK
jgi:hypothetical protein